MRFTDEQKRDILKRVFTNGLEHVETEEMRWAYGFLDGLARDLALMPEKFDLARSSALLKTHDLRGFLEARARE